MHAFLIGEAVRFGWHKTREHSGLLFKVVLTIFVMQVVDEVVTRMPFGLPYVAAQVAVTFVGLVLSTGFAVIVLRLAQGHVAHYRMLVPPGRMLWRYFLAVLLSTLIIVAGFVLLIIPGFFLLVRLSMVRYAIVDGAGVLESLRRSWHMTRGHWWRLFGFFITLIGINILGVLALVVGLLISVPLSMLAWAHVYNKLKSHPR